MARGITIDHLMENAGRATAEEATRHLPPPPAPVAIIAGPGNNGGDGAGAAFYLGQWGYAPEVWIVRHPSEIRSAAARRCWERIAHRCPTHVGVPEMKRLSEFPLIIDALLGTGQTGPLRSPYLEAVQAIAGSNVPVLSVDVPTGVTAANGLRPKWTVALSNWKEGMTAENSGDIVVRDIGMPPEAETQTGPGEFLLYPLPDPDRGRTCRVAIVAGGPYAGAPALAALAALRAGAERATVIAPKPAAGEIQTFSPDLVVRGVGEGAFGPADVAAVLSLLSAHRVQAVAIGMGAGRTDATREFYAQLLPHLLERTPVVVDADALGAVVELPKGAALSRHGLLATPNRVELKHNFGLDSVGTVAEQLEAVRRCASDRGITLVAKGAPDLLSDGVRSASNLTHHAAGSVGGAGDLLAGTLAHLLGEGLTGWEAARLGAHWIGSAGVAAYGTKSYGLTATDILSEMPTTLRESLARVEVFRTGPTRARRSGPGP